MIDHSTEIFSIFPLFLDAEECKTNQTTPDSCKNKNANPLSMPSGECKSFQDFLGVPLLDLQILVQETRLQSI